MSRLASKTESEYATGEMPSVSSHITSGLRRRGTGAHGPGRRPCPVARPGLQARGSAGWMLAPRMWARGRWTSGSGTSGSFPDRDSLSGIRLKCRAFSLGILAPGGHLPGTGYCWRNTVCKNTLWRNTSPDGAPGLAGRANAPPGHGRWCSWQVMNITGCRDAPAVQASEVASAFSRLLLQRGPVADDVWSR